jgi:hypothetical protein
VRGNCSFLPSFLPSRNVCTYVCPLLPVLDTRNLKHQNPHLLVVSILYSSQAWWYLPVIPALRSLRQKDCQFQASLGSAARPCLKTKKTKQQMLNEGGFITRGDARRDFSGREGIWEDPTGADPKLCPKSSLFPWSPGLEGLGSCPERLCPLLAASLAPGSP